MAAFSRYPILFIQFILTKSVAEFRQSVHRTASAIIPFLPLINANVVHQDKDEWVQWTRLAKILHVSLLARHIHVSCNHRVQTH